MNRPPDIASASCSIGVFVSRDTGEVREARCGSWRCRPCATRKTRRFAARYADRAPQYNRFITLTLPGRAAATGENLRKLSRGFRLLYFRLRRDFGLESYVWVREKGGINEQLHQHWAIRSRYIPQRRLSSICHSVGLGRVVDIRAVKSGVALRAYLGKYLIKQGGAVWPRHARIVQFSDPRPRPRSDESWIFIKGARAPWRRRSESESPLTHETWAADEMPGYQTSLDTYLKNCARRMAEGDDYEPG